MVHCLGRSTSSEKMLMGSSGRPSPRPSASAVGCSAAAYRVDSAANARRSRSAAAAPRIAAAVPSVAIAPSKNKIGLFLQLVCRA